MAEVVDGLRVGEPADAAGLDVDVLARADGDRLLGGLDADDGLVEAYGRLDLQGKLGVVEHVGVVEGLLNEGEVQLVDGLKEGQVVQRVAGVAVDVEGGVGEGVADDAQHLQVPARGHLELDAVGNPESTACWMLPSSMS